jgi:hypothetical protein
MMGIQFVHEMNHTHEAAIQFVIRHIIRNQIGTELVRHVHSFPDFGQDGCWVGQIIIGIVEFVIARLGAETFLDPSRSIRPGGTGYQNGSESSNNCGGGGSGVGRHYDEFVALGDFLWMMLLVLTSISRRRLDGNSLLSVAFLKDVCFLVEIEKTGSQLLLQEVESVAQLE